MDLTVQNLKDPKWWINLILWLTTTTTNHLKVFDSAQISLPLEGSTTVSKTRLFVWNKHVCEMCKKNIWFHPKLESSMLIFHTENISKNPKNITWDQIAIYNSLASLCFGGTLLYVAKPLVTWHPELPTLCALGGLYLQQSIANLSVAGDFTCVKSSNIYNFTSV